jgi:hypothetical protein
MQQLSFQQFAISNSEVMCFNKCKRKHMYEFLLRLTPVTQSPALHRGIIGHEILETYYESLMFGDKHSDAEDKALAQLDGIIVSAFEEGMDTDIAIDLRNILTSYFDIAATDDWTILAVEKDYVQEYEGIPVGMRLDILARINSGRFQGETLLIDHKFSYQAWSAGDVLMNGQPYKYGKILRDNGILVTKAMYNTIKYRTKDVTKLVDRPVLHMSQREQDVAIRDHVRTAKEIMAVREEFATGDLSDMVGPTYRNEAPRALDKYTCGMCSFRDICKAEMSHRTTATERMLESDFKANDYGYELSKEQ